MNHWSLTIEAVRDSHVIARKLKAVLFFWLTV